jgi:hypothetical protein
MTYNSIELLPQQNLKNISSKQTLGVMAETFACQIEWSDGTIIKSYIKRFKHENIQALANEVTGYIIAKGSNLPIPKYAGIITAPSKFFNDNSQDYAETCYVVSEAPGDNPGSFYEMGMMNECKALMDIIAGWPKISEAIAFDDWVANEDRNLGNILVVDKNNVYLIDHGNLPVKLNWLVNDLIVDFDCDNALAHNLWQLKCAPLPVKARIAASANDQGKIYQNVKSELIYWWGIFFSHDPSIINALEHFFESRANLGSTRVAKNFNMLAV